MKRILPLTAVLLLAASHATAEDVNSGNWIMPGCRAVIAGAVQTNAFRAGVCSGIISGVSIISGAGGLCIPSQVTNNQMLRVVVTYIDRQPALMHEPFRFLALAALQEAWPCAK